MNPLTIVVHGESGAGKSYLGATAPGPKLILDAEGGTKWLPGEKVFWNPTKDPKPPATEDICVATIKDFATMGKVFQVLQSGDHPFKSVVIDSLTEIQKRCLDAIAGTNKVDQQAWGELLRKMESLVRAFRDLSLNNGHSLNVVVVTGTQMKDGVMRPHLQGQLGQTIPYFFDVVGFLHVAADEDGNLERRLLVAPIQGFACKDRTGRLGHTVINPTITGLVESVN